MSVLSNVAKFVLGVLLAIAILMGGGVAAALYFMNKNSIPPPKPMFANDKPTLKVHRPIAKAKPQSQLLKPTDSSSKPVEPGAYRARVTWSDGLSLRSEPNQSAEHVASLNYNQKVVVLAQSNDQSWQRVRLEGSDTEGWIKAGNTEPVEKP